MCCRPSLGGWTHPRCRKKRGMDRLGVGLPYRGIVQQGLKKVKYKSQWDRIEFLFRLGKEKFDEQVLGEGSKDLVVTSVPMWKEKEKERGFNQAEVLARLVAKQYNLEYVRMLERVRVTKPMYGLKREEREKNVAGAFRIKVERVNKRVILVDDVWTTGATMRECAKILKDQGAKEVWGLAIAR